MLKKVLLHSGIRFICS